MKKYFTKTGIELIGLDGQSDCTMEREYETEYNREAMCIVPNNSQDLNDLFFDAVPYTTFPETKQKDKKVDSSKKSIYDELIEDYFRNGGR